MTELYDVIIVGSGAGGGTVAHTLAQSGKRILLLERHVVDTDFFPSIAAVNPALTAMANAIRSASTCSAGCHRPHANTPEVTLVSYQR